MKPKSNFFLSLVFLILTLGSSPSGVFAQDEPGEKAVVTLHVYGPGGPAPAMREAAQVFAEKKGIAIEVTAGPTATWEGQALQDADLIFSGAEHMMTDFQQKELPDLIDPSTIRTLYLRPSAILVRPGNPKNIRGVKDLAKSDLRLLVVQGAGQVGMWEDVAGRSGRVKLVDGIRRNIGTIAPNSGDAKKIWNSDSRYDAWLIWTIWQKENPASADLVATEPEHTIYRSCGIGVTHRSRNKTWSKEFADFLQSGEGRKIFVKWGWIAP